MTSKELARRDAIEHFGITEDEFDASREIIEGSLFYTMRRLNYAWADLVRNVRDSFRRQSGKGG